MRAIPQPLTAAALAVGLALAAGPGRAASGDDEVRIVVETPRPGQVVRARLDMAPLSGIAHAGNRPTRFDVMVVFDVSGSTAYPSGIDVDEDGEIGTTEAALLPGVPDTKNTDPQDSVQAAEVKAGLALLSGLNEQRVRVGVVSFSGEYNSSSGRRASSSQKDALLEIPLTHDYAAVAATLEALGARQPRGGTNMEAGIKLALRELASLHGAKSTPRRGAKRVILLLTDGKPSLPFGKANVEDPEDIEAVINAARLSKTAGVTINVYGLGPVAIDYPIAATEVARVTGGLYTPVRRPGDIVTMLTGVSFANVADVVAVNLTLGEMAGPDDILLSPDGSFRGFVPVRQGKNRIRVSALASDGTRGSTEFEIIFKHQDLTDAELVAERDRIRKRNRELQLLMERRQQEAFRRSERERMLEIEVEEGEGNKP